MGGEHYVSTRFGEDPHPYTMALLCQRAALNRGQATEMHALAQQRLARGPIAAIESYQPAAIIPVSPLGVRVCQYLEVHGSSPNRVEM